MDECKRVSMEGQNLRLDLSARFQDAIKDVSNKLEEQKDDCLSQLKENEMLRNKLKELADQYALSEQQYAQKLKQKTLELQLSDLKIKQHEEKLIQEQAQMKVYAEQVSQLLVTEKNLRMQLTADGEKFQQFQYACTLPLNALHSSSILFILTAELSLRCSNVEDALSKSNEVFETFKQEIEKVSVPFLFDRIISSTFRLFLLTHFTIASCDCPMLLGFEGGVLDATMCLTQMAKSIKELRKENVFLKSKCDKSDFTLIELVEERELMKKQLEKTKNQKEKLESLCRSLQAERKQSSTGSNGSNSLADQM
ncbi:hypothetical protein Gotur_014583 [Gossypium turneri]